MKIRLTDSIFKDSQFIGTRVLFALSADRLLAPFYEAVGKHPKAERYGGWESMGISGHSLGHYMTALSLCYETTGNCLAAEKARYVVDELSALQQDNGYICGFPEEKGFSGVFNDPENFKSAGFDLAGWWVPYYTLHKVIRGLIDVYEKIGYEKALRVVYSLCLWVYETTSTLNDEQRKRVLKCEYGGMNFVLSRLYRITGDERLRKASYFFCEEEMLIPLSENKDILTGKHANTQIPKIAGALEMYNNGGEDYLKASAENFFRMVSEDRSYAIGGNSVSEHFHELSQEPLEKNTCETCNSNNMLAFGKMLFEKDKVSRYYDYCERVLYNHILPSQDETGMKTYFVSLKSGHFKVYSTLEDSFWCCFGSGLENPFTYNEHISAESKEGIYVNLYIPSVIEGECGKFEIESAYPYEGSAKIKFLSDTDTSILLRKPHWCKGFSAEYNGSVFSREENGYVKIGGKFRQGEEIKIALPMNLKIHKKRDDEDQVYFTVGGIVLAERLGRENFPDDDHRKDQNELMDWCSIAVELLGSTETHRISNLEFTVDGHKLEPFFGIMHERYRVYFECTRKC